MGTNRQRSNCSIRHVFILTNIYTSPSPSYSIYTYYTYTYCNQHKVFNASCWSVIKSTSTRPAPFNPVFHTKIHFYKCTRYNALNLPPPPTLTITSNFARIALVNIRYPTTNLHPNVYPTYSTKDTTPFTHTLKYAAYTFEQGHDILFHKDP